MAEMNGNEWKTPVPSGDGKVNTATRSENLFPTLSRSPLSLPLLLLLSGTPGLNATDMVIYVTASQDATCNSGAAAWALPCVFEMDYNRPVMASINLCTKTLDAFTLPVLLPVVLHESFHALVRREGVAWLAVSQRTSSSARW